MERKIWCCSPTEYAGKKTHYDVSLVFLTLLVAVNPRRQRCHAWQLMFPPNWTIMIRTVMSNRQADRASRGAPCSRTSQTRRQADQQPHSKRCSSRPPPQPASQCLQYLLRWSQSNPPHVMQKRRTFHCHLDLTAQRFEDPATIQPPPTSLCCPSTRHVLPLKFFVFFTSATPYKSWAPFNVSKAGGSSSNSLGPSLSGVVSATAVKSYVYGNCKRKDCDKMAVYARGPAEGLSC